MEYRAVIVAGFGFRATADGSALSDALKRAQHGWPAVTALAAPEDKIAQLASLAATMTLPLIAVPPDVLQAARTTTRSHASFDARRTGSVAEASALAAAGPGARLLAPRHISADRMATCAIAEGPKA